MQEEIQTILGKYSSFLIKQLYIFHIVILHFNPTHLYLGTLGSVDIEIKHFAPSFVNILLILSVFDIPHGYRTQSNEMKRLSIDPQIKSAHFEYRNQAFGIMSIQHKR